MLAALATLSCCVTSCCLAALGNNRLREEDLCRAAVDADPRNVAELVASGEAHADTGRALMLAAWHGRVGNLFPLSLVVGVNRADRHEGRTALMCAARRGHPDCAMRLSVLGADPMPALRARNNRGLTALSIAASHGHPGTLAPFIDRDGAPTLIEATDHEGLTAAGHAARSGNLRELRELLLMGSIFDLPGGSVLDLVPRASRRGQDWQAVRRIWRERAADQLSGAVSLPRGVVLDLLEWTA